jgi:hypothetical protein
MKKLIILSVLVFPFINSCQKKPLEEPYHLLTGRYSWEYTAYRGSVFGSQQYIWPENSGFMADIEFHNDFTVSFFIDNISIETAKYKVKKKNAWDNEWGKGFEMELKVNVKNNEIKLNDKIMNITVYLPDTLFVGEYPYGSYKDSNNFHNHTNMFVRK